MSPYGATLSLNLCSSYFSDAIYETCCSKPKNRLQSRQPIGFTSKYLICIQDLKFHVIFFYKI